MGLSASDVDQMYEEAAERRILVNNTLKKHCKKAIEKEILKRRIKNLEKEIKIWKSELKKFKNVPDIRVSSLDTKELKRAIKDPRKC